MIDSFELRYDLSREEIAYIRKKFRCYHNYKITSADIDFSIPGLTFCIAYNKYSLQWSMYIKCHIHRLLKKASIYEEDLEIVNHGINRLLASVFDDTGFDLSLKRIDYKIDVRIDNPIERKMLFGLLNRMSKSHLYMKKYQNYESSVQYKSRSKKLIIYDKESERNAKCADVESHEENVVRFELQLLNRKLAYHQKNGIPKNLDSYFTENMHMHFLIGHLKNLVFPGDYYNIYHARKIIKASGMSPNEQDKLIEFLISISKNGSIDAVKEKKNYRTIKRRIEMLSRLGINPILIPQNWNTPCLKNPIKDFIDIQVHAE